MQALVQSADVGPVEKEMPSPPPQPVKSWALARRRDRQGAQQSGTGWTGSIRPSFHPLPPHRPLSHHPVSVSS